MQEHLIGEMANLRILLNQIHPTHGLKFWEVFGKFEPFGGVNIAFILKARVQGLRDLGASISPFNAWQIIQGVETLPLRMEKHSTNALKVAEFLSKHPKVETVLYPGLPSDKNHSIAKKIPPKRIVWSYYRF
jgi:O-acetylhomoserine (thiol)-lyase